MAKKLTTDQKITAAQAKLTDIARRRRCLNVFERKVKRQLRALNAAKTRAARPKVEPVLPTIPIPAPPEARTELSWPKTLKQLKADPRVVSVWPESNCGLWAELQPGWNVEDVHTLHEWSVPELLATFQRIERCPLDNSCGCDWNGSDVVLVKKEDFWQELVKAPTWVEKTSPEVRDAQLAEMQRLAEDFAGRLGVAKPSVRWIGTSGACTRGTSIAHVHTSWSKPNGRRAQPRARICVSKRRYDDHIVPGGTAEVRRLMAHEVSHLRRGRIARRGHSIAFYKVMTELLGDDGAAARSEWKYQALAKKLGRDPLS